jgi:hypothetical protein
MKCCITKNNLLENIDSLSSEVADQSEDLLELDGEIEPVHSEQEKILKTNPYRTSFPV